jgi:hypothetical protein
MKKLTFTMDDSVADRARMEAACRHTGASRLVGGWLAEKMRPDAACERGLPQALKFEPIPSRGCPLTRNEIRTAAPCRTGTR